MIDWEETDGGIRVFDRRSTMTIAAVDWENGVKPSLLPRPVDAAIAGKASRLQISADAGCLTTWTGATRKPVSSNGPIRLPEGQFVLDLETAIPTTVRFDGPAILRSPPPNDGYDLQFEGRQLVTLGFRTVDRPPAQSITIPPTVDGFATALTHFPVAHRTSGPERSHPAFRVHPPLVEFGTDTRIPPSISRNRRDSEIAVVLPDDDLMTLLVMAPLSYYLGARVVTRSGTDPMLTSDCGNVEHPFPTQPALEADVARLLRRIFFLDCLVRRNDPPTSGCPDPARFEIDPSIADASPTDRLETYLQIPPEVVDPHLPEWHLSTSVPPRASAATALPYLLDRMSLVVEPRTRQLDSKELLERSLTDFYRHADRPTASVDVVDAEVGPGRSHGWFGDEVPIDVFNATTTAFENGVSERTETDALDFHVVRNEPEMGEEHEIVARIYRERAEELPIDVTVYDGLSRDELAAVFEKPSAFVHYVGHCDVDGLRCSDGALPLDSIAQSNAETFFLNACGSFFEGMALVDRGSIAGGVTFAKVLNEQAATVGTTFARLIVHGFSIDRAMQLARRQIMMGKNYAIVGDGTYVLAGTDARRPVTYRIDAERDSAFSVACDVLPINSAGGCYRSTFAGESKSYLVGTPATTTMTRTELLEWLDSVSAPILYNGTLTWAKPLRRQLDN